MTNILNNDPAEYASLLLKELTHDREGNVLILQELRKANRKNGKLVRLIDDFLLVFLTGDKKEEFARRLYFEICESHRDAITIISTALKKVVPEIDLRKSSRKTWTTQYREDRIYLIQTESQVILALDNPDSEFQHFLVDYFRSLPHWARTLEEDGNEILEYCWIKKNMARFHTVPDEIDYLFTFGSTLMGHGLYEYAGSQFQEILNQDPDDHETLLRLSKCLTYKGQHQIAFRYLRRAVSIKPDDVGAHKELADCCAELGLFGMALETLFRAREVDQRDWEIHNNIGVAYSMLEEYGQAIEAYEKARELAPRVADIRRNIGLAQERMRQFDKAIEAYMKCSELEPENHDPHLRIGDVYEQMGNLSRAIEAYQKAIEISPDCSAYLPLGKVYEKLNRLPDARASYQEALKIWPRYKEARARLFRLDHPDMADLDEEMTQVGKEYPFLEDDPDAVPVIYEEAKRKKVERKEFAKKQQKKRLELN